LLAGTNFTTREDSVKRSVRFVLVSAVVLTLTMPVSGLAKTRQLAIGRDDEPRDPVKIIHRIVVWIFDELGVPRPTP
jgi:hypothetical protein